MAKSITPTTSVQENVLFLLKIQNITAMSTWGILQITLYTYDLQAPELGTALMEKLR
jgi:hypothetical protein